MNLKLVTIFISSWIILALVMVDHEAAASTTSPVLRFQPTISEDQIRNASLKSITFNNAFLQSCGTTLSGKYPTYGPVKSLVEEQAGGATVEITPAYSPNGRLMPFIFSTKGELTTFG